MSEALLLLLMVWEPWFFWEADFGLDRVAWDLDGGGGLDLVGNCLDLVILRVIAGMLMMLHLKM